jgi:phosphotransferase system enzyme I (PtsI)
MSADGARPAASTVCFTMHGIGISGGIAIGHAHLFAGMSAEVDHYAIPAADVPREQRRYDRAVKEVREELKALAQNVRQSGASELEPFVKVHLMLLDDDAFSDAPREIVRRERCNAEWALRLQLDELLAQFTDSPIRTCASARPTCGRWPSACWRRWPAPR